MVKRVLHIFYREVRGLHQAAYVLGLFAFGSQLLALVRDRLLAHEFGAGALLDVYYTAFRIPDVMYVLFASSLSVYVLIPFVAKAKEANGNTEAKKLLSNVFSLFLIAYTVMAALAFVFAPQLLSSLFTGIDDQVTLVSVTRILLLQPLFLGISSLFGVVTQLGHRFVLYAISPLIYNLGIIFGISFLYPLMGLRGLALGVVLGAIGHMLIQLPFVSAHPLSFRFTHRLDWPQIKNVLRISIPRAITLSINQVVLLVLISLASAMAVGSVSVFQFAYNLESVPLAVIGVSYSVAAFPLLAQLYTAGELDKFKLHIITALRHVLFWSIPAIALIVVLRAHIVRVVLGSGEFDWSDTRLTAAVLAVLSLGLVAQAVNLLIIRAFYAGGYTRTPFFVALGGGLLSIVMAYSFYVWYIYHAELQSAVSQLMRLSDVAGSEVLTIAAGYAFSVIVQSLVLLIMMRQTFGITLRSLFTHTGKCLVAALAGAISAYATLQFLVGGINPDTFVGIFIQGTLAGLMGVVGVILTYAGLRTPELHEIYSSFQRKLLRTDVVAPERDVL